MDAQEDMHMNDYNKITALYSRLSVGDEDRDGGESNSIQNQKIFLENYARGQRLTNIRHYIDDDESGRFFDRSAYSRMMEDVENGKIGVCIMKDLTRWGRDYLQVGNAMEIFRRNNVRFIAVNNGIDSEKPDTLEFAPFINIMSEWYAKDISKKVKTGIKTKGMSGKPIATEAPYGYVKDPDNKDFWIIDEEAAEVVRLIFRLFIGGKNRNQIAVYLTQEQIPTPTFYMKDRGRGTCKNKALNEDNRYKWNKATLTHILTRQEYCGDVVNFKTTKHFRDKRNHYVDRSQWQITENVHEPIIDRADFETAQRILENAPVRRPNGDGEIHPLSGLLFCKDCGAKMHIRIDYRNGGKRHVAYCSEYHKGKAKNPKCHSPHIIDADLLMQTVAEVLKKIEDYSISNRAEFEALVKKNLAMQQTDQTKKQQKRIPQITTRLEQIDKVLNKLYEDNALGTIDLLKPIGRKRRTGSKAMTDTDMKYIRLYLEDTYGLTSEKKIADAADLAADANSYHPIRDYLNGLVWDGKERIRYCLRHFLGADTDNFTYHSLRLFLLGAIHRAFCPGCKFEVMLCLVGGQGAGKSTFFRLLAVKDEWFSDDLRKLDDDNVYRKLEASIITDI